MSLVIIMLKSMKHFHKSDFDHHHCLTYYDCLPWTTLVCDNCGRTIKDYGPTGAIYIASDVPEDAPITCNHDHHLPIYDARKPRNKFPAASKTVYCDHCYTVKR